MRIALALSGGGFRATLFHLGVLARLAEEDLLEKVTYLSTVSGGSLCAGLVFAQNNFTWPTSAGYKNQVLPRVREVLLKKDLKAELIKHVLTHLLEIADTRADDLSELMQDLWGVKIALKDLPPTPRWMINTTCYETGKNWRFERFRMGDYLFGYSYDTNVPLSDALAASAGFPGLIGALAFPAAKYKWFKYKTGQQDTQAIDEHDSRQRKTAPVSPAFSPVHLWDGGVYDNHGLEGLHDFIHGWREGIDFLIVSDASGKPKPEPYRAGVKALERIVTGIMMDQVRSLRARAIMERILNHEDRGAFLQIGNTSESVFRDAGLDSEIAAKCKNTLSESEATQAAEMETDIARPDEKTFQRLFRHGFEVADATLYARNPDLFKFTGYHA